MNRLILLRHGNAEQDSEHGGDFARELSAEGRTESWATGETLLGLGLIPDLVLASSAARTRGTWAAMASLFPKSVVQLEDGLYLAESSAIREAVRKAAPTCETLLVVGHNPGIQDLVLDMLRESSGPLSVISRVESRFPTAAAAVFVIDAQGRPLYDGLFFPDKVR